MFRSKLNIQKPLAPYESCWSVFLKLQILNSLSPRKMVDFFKESANRQAVNFWDAGWMNLDVFKQATGIPKTEIENSFPPRLGSSCVSERVRHCPECIKSGYHCSLFQLRILTKCPWHNCFLEECVNCTRLVKSAKDKSVCDNRFGVNSICGHIKINLAKSTNFTDIRAVFFREAEIFFQEFESFYHFTEGLDHRGRGEIFEPGQIGNNKYVNLACSFYEKITSKQFRFILYEVQPVKIIHIGSAELSDTNPDPDQLKACIKSVRRHIIKHYLKSHKKCANKISKVEYNGNCTYFLADTCQIALAFFLWNLKFSSPQQGSPKFLFRYRPLFDTVAEPSQSINYWLHRILLNFFDIWSRIALHSKEQPDHHLVITYSGVLSFLNQYVVTWSKGLRGEECCAIYDPEYLRSLNCSCCSDTKYSPRGYSMDYWIRLPYDILRLYSDSHIKHQRSCYLYL